MWRRREEALCRREVCHERCARPASVGPGYYERISRQTFWRAVVAGAVILAGVLVINGAERAFHLTFDKPPMPLAKAFPLLSKELGSPVRYVARGLLVPEESDSTMPEDQLEVLETRQYLLRRYVDLRKPVGDPTAALHVNLNYYPKGNSIVHVPEICWAGNGMIEAPGTRHVFEVPDVRRKDGTVMTLGMRMVSFQPPEAMADKTVFRNVAYVFQVNGDYVATPMEVTSRFWRASSKYAYVTKIEVTVGDGGQYCSQEQAQTAISDFMRAALPEIEECLPDPHAADPDKGVSSAQSRN